MADYLVQEEDGTSRFKLEDATGFILLEEQGPPPPGGSGNVYIPTWRPRRSR